MLYWIAISAVLIPIQFIKSDDIVEVGKGRCQRRWNVTERIPEYFTVTQQHERYRWRTMRVLKSRVKILSKPMQVDFCCQGYRQVYSVGSLVHECEPICEPMCVNGDCTAPGNCTCNEGYGKSSSSNHICEHKCDPGCVNGTCVGVNDCECYAGFFKATPLNPHACSPRCTFGCNRGECTGPEICSCHPGYTLSSNHSICDPFCNLECTNGYCSGPNSCTCDEGYVETPSWNICEPYCSEPCINGQCTSPENCTCWDGYFKSSNATCDPSCSNPCHNGACIAPETCSCDERYEKDERDNCIPICSLGCANGTCASPDNCLCDDRHYYSNGTCIPWCADGCKNGDCTGPNGCSCYEGTFKMTESYCGQSCFNVSECVNLGSVDFSGNLTSLKLIWDSTSHQHVENHPAFCSQKSWQYCCSALCSTQGDSFVIACSPIDENFECDSAIDIPDYLWTGQYEVKNDTNVTIKMVIGTKHDHEYRTRPCYFQLCPGKSFNFVSGATRIKCSSKSETVLVQMEVNESYGTILPEAVTIGALLVVIAAIAVTTIFYYVKRVRKISYRVNSDVAGGSIVDLNDEQEETHEDEL